MKLLLWLFLLAPAMLLAQDRKILPRGTFLQWYLAEKWGDKEWQAEFKAMREVGMDIMILTPAANTKLPEAYYPTALPGVPRAKGYPDLVDLCLRNAEKAGIKVFVGLNSNDDWWEKSSADRAWILHEMELGNQIATDLYRKYKAKYPKAFYGWYWDWEVDNVNFSSQAREDNLAKALEVTLNHLNGIDAKMPMMFCPFMNSRYGTADKYGAFWKRIFAAAPFRKGDIFCPQDCVGAGGAKLNLFPQWFKEFQEAIKVRPGMELWVDTETFEGEEQAATLDRVAKQIDLVQPYVSGMVTFAYSHYYSPVSCNPGWQSAFKTMLKAGQNLPKDLPTPPRNVQTKLADKGEWSIRWSAQPNDGYEVYIANRVVAKIGPPAKPRKPGATETVTLKAPLAGEHYNVRAYNFYGRRSAGVDAKP